MDSEGIMTNEGISSFQLMFKVLKIMKLVIYVKYSEIFNLPSLLLAEYNLLFASRNSSPLSAA